MNESGFAKPTIGKIDLDTANVQQLREEALLAIIKGDRTRMQAVDERLRVIDGLKSKFRHVLGDVRTNED